MGSRLKQMLKSLCYSNGWCYGVFWRLNCRNSMLLTLEDAYFEEQIGCVLHKMFQQVHMLGEGIIGQTAFSREHLWMFSDALYGEWDPKGPFVTQEISQDNSEFRQQFLSGIKTIAVIPMVPQGIFQFGSTQKILERLDFVDHVRRSFQSLESVDGLFSGIAASSFNSEIHDPSGTVTSIVSSGNSCSNYGYNKTFNDGRNKVVKADSIRLKNNNVKSQFPIPSPQAQVILSPLKTQLPQGLSQLTSNEGSAATSFGRQGEETSGLLNSVTNAITHVNNKHIGYNLSRLANMQLCSTDISELSKCDTGCHTFPGEFRQANATTGHPKANPLENLSQWIAETLEQGNGGFTPSLGDNIPQRLDVASISSGFLGSDVFGGIPTNCTATSMENSISETINSLSVVCDGKDKSVNLPTQLPADNDLFDSLGFDFRQSQGKGFWDDVVSRLGNSSCSNLSMGASECISDMDAGSMASIPKGLLSDLGLEQLLEGFLGNSSANNTKPSSEDQFSTSTTTVTGNTLAYGNQAQFGVHSLLGGTMDDDRMIMHKNQKENVLKSQVSSWIDDSYSINTESTTVTNPKKSDEQGKATRKRARPGESTRPRPKDRQQIQDRVKELREIVPNGSKCSIDALLDRTIKHMLFLQNVTKYADKIKQADEPKIIGEASGVVLKDNSNGSGGATWAFEVGGQTMVCPIVVEDLSPPGQMLIEMLCEERGFFLEIADIIKGFGLTILKGVMEVQETKIWARFVVEANKDVTRMDIFLSLVQLLQQTASTTTTTEVNSSNQQIKSVDSGVPLFGNYQQSQMPLPIGLADQLH